jgi:hypothetical protein
MEQLPKRLNLIKPEREFDKILTSELMRYTLTLFNLVGKGTIPLRMTTTERDTISSPIQGLIVFNTTTAKLNFYNGTDWKEVTSA